MLLRIDYFNFKLFVLNSVSEVEKDIKMWLCRRRRRNVDNDGINLTSQTEIIGVIDQR